MKKIILIAAVLLPTFALAQQPFVIKGDVKTFKNGEKIYLSYLKEGGKVIDSTNVTNGAFEFKGSIGEPAQANLFKNIQFLDRDKMNRFLDFANLYVEAGNILIKSPDSLKSAVAIGTTTNLDQTKLNEMVKPYLMQMNAVNDEYSKLSPEHKRDENIVTPLKDKARKTADQMTESYLAFVKENPNSYVSLNALVMLAGSNQKMAEAANLYNTLSANLKSTKLGSALGTFLGSAKSPVIGAMAKDFTQNDPNGKPVKLSDFRGKYVLVDFWASWCGPCRRENPNVVAAYQKFKDKNFTVLGVSLDREGEKANWLKAIADDKLTWTHVSDLKWWQNEVAQAWGIESIPANFLIDPTGKIIDKGLTGEALHRKLAELLNNKSK